MARKKEITAFLAVFFLSAAAEGLSWAFFGHEAAQRAAIVLIAIAAFLAAVKEIRWLFLLAVAEMVIGGHGRLFAVETPFLALSARMVIFAILLGAWVVHVLRGCSRILHVPHARLLAPLIAVLASVAWGMLRARTNGIPVADAAGDADGFAFLALIPIAIDLIADREWFARASRVFAASAAWLSAKTLLLLYFFSHEFPFLSSLYSWQRKAWLSEITRLDGGFYRVFSASHVFLLLGLFTGFYLFWRRGGRGAFAWLSALTAAFLLSLSRSFWLGALVALAFMMPVLARLRLLTADSLKALLLRGAGVFAVAGAILAALILFPAPERLSDPSRFGAFGSRLTFEDAAVSSRWNMLEPIAERIKKSPFLGSGFGTAVTYVSDDPRVHDLYPGGLITTTAIEWQYLALWMKGGVFALFAFVWLWWRIGLFGWKALQSSAGDDVLVAAGLLSAFLAFILLNVFTPYLNHPLGWMFLALVVAGFHTSAEGKRANEPVHAAPSTEPEAS